MPFVSQEQRRWMYANYPKMAEQWDKHTPKGKILPERVRPKELRKPALPVFDMNKREDMKTNIKVILGGILLVAWLVAAIFVRKFFPNTSYLYIVIAPAIIFGSVLSAFGMSYISGLCAIEYLGGDHQKYEKSQNPFIIFGVCLIGFVALGVAGAVAGFLILFISGVFFQLPVLPP